MLPYTTRSDGTVELDAEQDHLDADGVGFIGRFTFDDGRRSPVRTPVGSGDDTMAAIGSDRPDGSTPSLLKVDERGRILEAIEGREPPPDDPA